MDVRTDGTGGQMTQVGLTEAAKISVTSGGGLRRPYKGSKKADLLRRPYKGLKSRLSYKAL